MRFLIVLLSTLVASSFVLVPATVLKPTTKYAAAADVNEELERPRKENEDLKELQRLKKENEDMRSLALPKNKFFDKFFGVPQKKEAPEEKSVFSLLDEMDELLHSSTSLLGGLMNNMLSSEGFMETLPANTKDDIAKVTAAVKENLEKNGELGEKVIVDPPASQSYYKETINGKESTSISLILRAHNEEDTNVSGIVKAHAKIDENGQVQCRNQV